MDAHTHTNPDGSVNIVASATKEEWIEVIRAVTYRARNDESEKLVHWLINQGVYE